MARLLEEYKQGVLGKTIGSTPELITGIESEAVEGERIAAAFPPGRHREAALRVVARLDLITVDLTNQILQANRPD